MVRIIDEYGKAAAYAGTEYAWLLDKFPGKTSIIMSYAHFSDTVLNDAKAAQKLRHEAA
ncbi:hypothetical protein T484DRAFT_1816827, partial [Baffinella frigidus]